MGAKLVVFDSHMMAAREYWVSKLSQNIEDSNIRLDYQRDSGDKENTKSIDINITGEIYQKLRKLTGGSSFLLYTMLMAALEICLHKYTGNSAVVVGSPTCKTTGNKSIQRNALTIVAKIDRRQSFREFLLIIRQTLLDAYKNQQYPFERLVQDLALGNIEHKFPLFDVALTLTDIHDDLPDIKNDITLIFIQKQEFIAGRIEFNNNLFKQETLARFSGHFLNVLKNTLENIDVLISDVQMTTEAEHHQLLTKWNKTERKFPENKCIHELFEYHAEKNADATAVEFKGETLSYGALNARANSLARYLHTIGIGPEVMVGICVDRSFEMAVGILGILKAGGTYIPLDTEYPDERLSFILADADLSVVLTVKEYQEKAGKCLASARCPVMICLDTDWPVILEQDTKNFSSGIAPEPEHSAYVIYTSGTTGKPKGVPIAHRSVCNLVNAQIRIFEVQAGSRVLQFASFSFDASVSEIFMALASGATLCFGTKEALLPGTPLAEFLNEHAITHVTLPPSILAVMPSGEIFPALRSVIVAGEACSAELAANWSKGRKFFNAYGPTETTVCATIAECSTIHSDRKPPIGHAIDNIQLYILDPDFQPVPVGVPGELYIGGVGLSKGYINRPELNAEKFILNPFSNEPGARLYKTGDTVCRLADGNIEFIGRVDHQVKLRGFRIEPEEIEAVLATHPDVQDNVVIVREDHPGDQRLVAYFIPRRESVPISNLREFLKKSLPDHMIPSNFVILNTLPLTPNKKVDRRSLPVPDAYSGDKRNIAEPRDETELQLLRIWEEVLELNPISIKDDFFELGGHSLLAVRMMSQIQQQFEKSLPLATLFKNPTIEKLATVIHHQLASPSEALVAIQPSGSKQPFFCVHPAGGNVFCYTELSDCLGTEQPFYGLQSLDLTGKQNPPICIEDISARYIKELQDVCSFGPYRLGGWSLGGIIAFEMAHQLIEQGHTVSLLVLIDSYTPKILDIPEDIDDSILFISFMRDLAEMAGTDVSDLSLSVDELPSASDDRFSFILQQARKNSILPPEVTEEQIKHLWYIFKSNMQAVSSYQPPSYPGSIHLFTGTDKPFEVAANGWADLAQGGVKIHNIPGNHYSLLRSPHVAVLADKLNNYLQGQ